jgi:hypothetical protein
MRLRTILIGIAVAALAFVAATVAMQVFLPAPAPTRAPPLTEVPPLPPVSRTSVIVAPVTIPLTAIAAFMEANAPPEVAGKRDFKIGRAISNGEIHWTVRRGPLSVAGRPETIAVATLLTGTVRATGQLSQAAGGIAGALGELLGKNGGRGDKRGPRTFDQGADMRGDVMLDSRPALAQAWRVEPNLAAQVSVADASLNLGGMRVNLSHEVQPFVDRAVNERVKELEARLRNDPTLERAVQREWAKLCRSQSIGATRPGLPDLWLELRPRRAFAAQPRIDASAVTLLIGVEAEARIVPQQSRPDCPFPATLEFVAPSAASRIAIALPIDVPFTELNRLMATQLAGKTFGEGRSDRLHVTVRQASVAPSGNRLLISMRVQVREQRSWFGFGIEATVHVWGRPVLDRDNQVLRLTDVALDVESEGVFGSAAKAFVPLFESAVAQQAAVDLKPYAANARRSIETAIADFRGAGEGVRVDAAIKELRLADIAFDAQALRLIAEVEGSASVAVSKLPAK